MISIIFIHILIDWLTWERERDRDRDAEREKPICFSLYLCIYCLILVCALTEDWTCNLGVWGWCSNQLSCPAKTHSDFYLSYFQWYQFQYKYDFYSFSLFSYVLRYLRIFSEDEVPKVLLTTFLKDNLHKFALSCSLSLEQNIIFSQLLVEVS